MNRYLFRIILRFFNKERINVSICIAGFFISLFTVFIIAIYVNHELSYDRIEESENIYRVIESNTYSTEPQSSTPLTLYNVKQEIQDHIPDINSITRIFPVWDAVNIKIGENIFSEHALAYIDVEFLNVFPFQVTEGTPEKLNIPNTLILTETFAKKYFGNTPAHGQQILIDNIPFLVSAVIKDIPSNFHFKFNILASLNTLSTSKLQQEGSSFYTYLKLNKNIDQANVLQKLTPLLCGIYEQRNQELGIERKTTFNLQPLENIHLYSHLPYELSENGNPTHIKICILLGFLVLLISAINFANITTVLSEKKIRFFSINKVIGATQNNINKLLCLEVFLLILISLVAATLTVCFWGKWCITELLGVEIQYSIPMIFHTSILFIGLSICLFLLSITFAFASFSRITLLSGFSGINQSGKKWSFTLYRVLLCIQLITATTLVGCLYKSHSQITYLKSQNLGFDKENVLVYTNIPWKMQSKLPLVQNEISKLSFIDKTTVSGEMPGNQMPSGTFTLEDDNGQKNINCQLLRVDSNYLSAMGITLLEGEFFNASTSIKKNVVINESAAKAIGLKNIIGRFIEFWGQEYIVSGIIKDFHTTSLHNTILPMLLIQEKSAVCDLALHSSHLSADHINTIQYIFKQYIPDYIPESYWISDKFNSMYQTEEQIENINWGLVIISMIIAFMGIWSFASLFIGKKWKEMGIRKTFGAESKDLISILLKNFIPITLTAFLFSTPIIYFFSAYFNDQFAYNNGISFMPFIIGFITISLIITAIISYHCLLIAKLNPVKVIKNN